MFLWFAYMLIKEPLYGKIMKLSRTIFLCWSLHKKKKMSWLMCPAYHIIQVFLMCPREGGAPISLQMSTRWSCSPFFSPPLHFTSVFSTPFFWPLYLPLFCFSCFPPQLIFFLLKSAYVNILHIQKRSRDAIWHWLGPPLVCVEVFVQMCRN